MSISTAVVVFLVAQAPVSPGRQGMDKAAFLKSNNIDPAAPAAVSIVQLTLPPNCEQKVVAAFVEARWRGWSRLHQKELEDQLGGTDFSDTIELALRKGKPSQSTLAFDTGASVALLERLQADFLAIRFSPTCSGPAQIVLRFHLPSER